MIFKLLKLAMERFSAERPPTRVFQKVTLSDSFPLAPSEEFPIEGTSYECGGVVQAMNRRRNTAVVNWYNGRSVNIKLRDLRVLSELDCHNLRKRGFVADNPNFTFKARMQNKKKSRRRKSGREKINSFQNYFTMTSGTGNNDGNPYEMD